MAFPLLVNTSFLSKKSHCWLCPYRTIILMRSSWNCAHGIRNCLVFAASAPPKHNAEVCNFILIFFWSCHIFRFSQISTQRWKTLSEFSYCIWVITNPQPTVMVSNLIWNSQGFKVQLEVPPRQMLLSPEFCTFSFVGDLKRERNGGERMVGKEK